MINGGLRILIRQALEAEVGTAVWLELLETMKRDRDETDRLIDLVRAFLDAELSRSENQVGAPSAAALTRLEELLA